MYDEQVPVLIVGAGCAGLAAAVSLSWRGIPAVLVERHSDTSIQPKAYGLNSRAMEMLRQAPGLEETLRRKASAFRELFEQATAGCAPPISLPDPTRPTGVLRQVTPVAELGLHQADIERVLRAKAEELGSDLRFSTQLTSFEQDSSGVTAAIKEANGARRTVRASYLVAADGHNSPVRTALNIPAQGKGTLAQMHLVAFDADLSGLAPDTDLDLYYVLNRDPVIAVAFAATHVDTDSHLIRLTSPPGGGPGGADLSRERYAELIRAATGRTGLDIEITDHATFAVGHALAERFAVGRVFLAGDAAHVMPPSGGQSASTAVHDGWDIGWRLALVLTRQAGRAFLDSYDAERRPVCQLIADHQLTHWSSRMPGRPHATSPPGPDDRIRLTLGYRYQSGAVIGEKSEDMSATENPLEQSGRPGSRAPHVVLERSGTPLSTLDLFGTRFVLLAGPDGAGWADVANHAAEQHQVPLAAYVIGTDLTDTHGTWCERYGVEAAGASLVRPDGHVAWRSSSGADNEPRVLCEALSRILAANPA